MVWPILLILIGLAIVEIARMASCRNASEYVTEFVLELTLSVLEMMLQ
jgi:hypothetical protein